MTRMIPLWSSLNRVERSRILWSSYFWLILVPILAKLLIKVGPEIQIPIGKSVVTFNLDLPFSWKMFYFASVAFAVASFIYSVWCPEFVRRYSTFSDYTDDGKG